MVTIIMVRVYGFRRRLQCPTKRLIYWEIDQKKTICRGVNICLDIAVLMTLLYNYISYFIIELILKFVLNLT